MQKSLISLPVLNYSTNLDVKYTCAIEQALTVKSAFWTVKENLTRWINVTNPEKLGVLPFPLPITSILFSPFLLGKALWVKNASVLVKMCEYQVYSYFYLNA